MRAAGLAVALARDGVPFRSAHTIVGSIVSAAEKEGASIESVAARELAKVAPNLVPRLPGLLAAEESVASKKARGGTAPDAVRESLVAARARTRAPSG
jgi:argininosuccinate lyase